MKFIALVIFAFSLLNEATADPAKSNHLDFNSYVRENYEILSHVRRPAKERHAFEEPKARAPENAASPPQNVDYGVDKNGNGAAGSAKSIWGSMSGQGGPAQLPAPPPEAPPVAAPAAPPADGSSSSSSSSSSGGGLPQ